MSIFNYEKTTALDAIPLFHWMSEQSRQILQVAAAQRAYGPGEWIMREGEYGDRMFILAEGEVEVVKGAGTAKEVALATLKKNSTFGEMCLVEGLERSASVRAKTACMVLALTDDSLNRFGNYWPKEHAILLTNLTREFARRLRATDQAFASRAY